MIVELSATEQASYGSADNQPNLGRLKPRMQDKRARNVSSIEAGYGGDTRYQAKYLTKEQQHQTLITALRN